MFGLTTSYITLFMSSIFLMLSSSWIIIWSLMEINVMSFTSMKTKKSKEEYKNTISASLKYFLIQSMSSAVLFVSALMMEMNESWNLYKIFMMTMLMLKMASIPMHRWFIDINKVFSPVMATILMTWQKLIPITILTLTLQNGLDLFILSCGILSPIETMNTKGIMEIMTLSSIFNNSWMILSSQISTSTTVVFMILYWWAVMFMMLEIFKLTNFNKMTHSSNLFTLTFTANLSSLPPTSGFLAKWILSIKLMSVGFLYYLTTLIFLSIINVFIYFRMNSLKFMMYMNKNKPIFKLGQKIIISLSLLMVFIV